jgi:predicted nucleic acid-binding protein
VKFWDSSAIAALLLDEAARPALETQLDADPAMAVWWATSVECVSAIARREREARLPLAGATAAVARLRALALEWHETPASEAVRATAERLLRVHPLRAADALQLAAAIVASGHDPSSLEFVCLDDRLADCATREGFRVVAMDSTGA